jgi:predicted small metal-binding protein
MWNETSQETGVFKYHIHENLTMLSVTCRDVGVDCDFKGTGETENELMNNLVEHAIKDHGYTREDVMKPEMQEKIKAHIQKS